MARLARHVLHDRDGALAHERDRHRVGAHALARDTAGGMGGVEARQLGWLGRGLRVRRGSAAFSVALGLRLIAGAARIVIIGRGGG